MCVISVVYKYTQTLNTGKQKTYTDCQDFLRRTFCPAIMQVTCFGLLSDRFVPEKVSKKTTHVYPSCATLTS